MGFVVSILKCIAVNFIDILKRMYTIISLMFGF